MTYRSRSDKELMAMLSHYERTVAECLRANRKTPQEKQRARLAYMGATTRLLDYIDTTVNDARDEGARNPEHYDVN